MVRSTLDHHEKKNHDPPLPLTGGKDTTSSSVWFFSFLSLLSLLSLSTSSSLENEKKTYFKVYRNNIFIKKIIIQQTVLRSEDDYVNDESSELSRASDISRGRGTAKFPQKTRNTAKSARNISKYMSAKHI